MNTTQISVSIQPLPNRALLATALGNDVRWQILKELSGGEPRMVMELAKIIGCSRDAASKQLAVLRRAGAVVQGRGRLYSIPKQYLPQPGQPVVDFGHCLLRLDAGGYYTKRARRSCRPAGAYWNRAIGLRGDFSSPA